MEEAAAIHESVNFADYSQTNSNVLQLINTGILSSTKQGSKTNADGHRQGTSAKRKKSQRPTPQYQETLKRPAKASKSQAANKTRTKQATQQHTRENLLSENNKLMSTYLNPGRNATAQHVLPE